MNYSILLPFIYLCIGIACAKSGIEKHINIKYYASALLMRVCIPLVIIYNITYHQRGVFSIVIAMMLIMAIMQLCAMKITKNSMISLCFCYVNIGWLGLPVVLSLYGNEAAVVVIAAYIGNSIFGNSSAAGILMEKTSLAKRLSKVIFSPSVVAVLIGLILMPVAKNWQPYFVYPYDVAKFTMSVLGMVILGLWMANLKISKQDFISALTLSLSRIIMFSALASILVAYAFYYDIQLILDNLTALYLIGFLPPAANIIVLETYYQKTGKSASIIASGTVVSVFLMFFYVVLAHYIF